MKNLKLTPRQTLILSLAFLAAAAIVGVLAFRAARDLVLAWRVPGMENIQPFEPEAVGAEKLIDPDGGQIDATIPLQPGTGPASKPWDGVSRVTILLLGVDKRDWLEGGGVARTDTIIVVSIDPTSQAVGMLSLPRDLWVPIPEHGYGKINTAYQLGEIEKLPGGGPGLVMATVQTFLNIPIDYYAQIDFNAFIHLIDEMGGVKLDIPEKIKVDPLGSNNTKVIKPGIQTLSGSVALAYARARNTIGGDFDRAHRQQQVLLGVRERILSFELLPVLVSKAPILYNDIANGVATNLTMEQIIRLALVFQNIPTENIHHGVIGPNQVTFDFSPEGLDILQPLPEPIRELRDDILSFNEPIVPLASQGKSTAQLMQEEEARIAVLNATYTIGLASRTTEYLQQQGVDVAVTDNATKVYEQTTIIDYTGKPNTLQFLSDLMGIQQNRIFHSFDPMSEIDIEINLGQDWVSNPNLP